ncbi:hypothetical protein BGZ61DRAFT_3041 [Ilyonectria robusta]|uniref:uncharacterized protein n=1 Tax=Ilyonectria robusta TaxID=1079257 RepID=UPI001E8EBB71|nr:uncharacterized protein BGZ61DRAFT_3041 [Ilyonectria robusta]KAH8736787.1 hypothetical protein BGZ61DRAFT_3041 [Ilyonectria robusta]
MPVRLPSLKTVSAIDKHQTSTRTYQFRKSRRFRPQMRSCTTRGAPFRLLVARHGRRDAGRWAVASRPRCCSSSCCSSRRRRSMIARRRPQKRRWRWSGTIVWRGERDQTKGADPGEAGGWSGRSASWLPRTPDSRDSAQCT